MRAGIGAACGIVGRSKTSTCASHIGGVVCSTRAVGASSSGRVTRPKTGTGASHTRGAMGGARAQGRAVSACCGGAVGCVMGCSKTSASHIGMGSTVV